MKKQILHTFVLFFCYTAQVYAQVSDSYKPQNAVSSPTAAGLAKQANETTNLYNGTVSLGIPLFSFQENQLNLSASMSYNTGGIPVKDYGTWLGLGWNLNCGGMITRRVNGYTDETYWGSWGILDTQALPNKFNDSFWGTVSNNLQYRDELKGIFEGTPEFKTDYAPDDYTFNFMGISGSFFFDRSNNAVVSNKFKVIYDNRLSKFELISTDGTKYIFASAEVIFTASINYANYGLQKYFLERGDYDSQNPLTTTWYLSKVVSSDGNNSIDFTYEFGKDFSNNQLFEYSTNENYLPSTNIYYNLLSVTKSVPVLIKEIKTKNYICKFSYNNFSAKGHHIQLIDLSTIEGEYLKSFYFEYKSIDGRRNLLTSVTELRKDTKEANSNYTFDYFEQPINYVENSIWSSTSGIDHWGFYNGEKATPYNSLIPNINVGPISYSGPSFTVPARVGITDRNPNENAKANLLKKITNTYGGYKEIFYEPNKYSYVNNTIVETSEKPAGGMRISKIIDSDGKDATKNIIKEYEYKDPDNVNLSSGVLEYEPTYNFSYNGYNYVFGNSIKPISLGYGFVKEKFADGSYKTYKFNTSKDYPYLPYPEDNSFYLETDSFTDFNTPNTTFNSTNFVSIIGDAWFKSTVTLPNSSIVVSNYTYKKYKIKKETHPFGDYQGQNHHLRGLLVASNSYSSIGDIVSYSKNTFATKELGRTYSIIDKKIFDVFLTSYLPGASVNTYAGPEGKSNIFLSHYVKAMRIPELTETEQRIYNLDDKTKYITTKTNYLYHPINDLVWKESTTGSDGSSIEKQTSYITDFENTSMNGIVGVLKQKNMIGLPVEQRLLKRNNIVSGGLNIYNEYGKPVESYSLETATPLNNTTLQEISHTPKTFAINATYYKKKLDLAYDPCNKQLIEEKPSNGSFVSTLWGYKNTKPIAQVLNTNVGLDINKQTNYAVWTGTIDLTKDLFDMTLSQKSVLMVRLNLTPTFQREQDYFQIIIRDKISGQYKYSNWYYSGNNEFTIELLPSTYTFSCDYLSDFDNKNPFITSIEVDKITESRNIFYTSFEEDTDNVGSTAKTGKKSHIGTYGVPIPNNVGTYILSYFEKLNASSNWIRKEEEINTAGIEKTIGVAGGYIDEVRLHKKEGLMTTFTHDFLGGTLSKQDANGIISYFDYDKIGRLNMIKNNENNLLKSYSYTPRVGKNFKPRVGVTIPPVFGSGTNDIFALPLPSNMFLDDDGQIVNIVPVGLPQGFQLVLENNVYLLKKISQTPLGKYNVILKGYDNSGDYAESKIIIDIYSTTSINTTGRYNLYKAGTKNERYFLKILFNNEVIKISDYASLGKLNIIFEDRPLPEYVLMSMTGPINQTTTEYKTPFALFGDNDGFVPIAGTYNMVFKSYWFGRFETFNLSITFIN